MWTLEQPVLCFVLSSKEGNKAVSLGLMTGFTQIPRIGARSLVPFLTEMQAMPLL